MDFEGPNCMRAHTWAFELLPEQRMNSAGYDRMAIHTHYSRKTEGLGLVVWGSASTLALDGTKPFLIT